MQTTLLNKLHQHLQENYPDLLLDLQATGAVTGYLHSLMESLGNMPEELLAAGYPPYEVEEICIEELLVKGVGPSKYNFFSSLLQDEFADAFNKWSEVGILVFEIVNLIELCKDVFEGYNFTEQSADDLVFVGKIKEKIGAYLMRLS